jgi:hypothetical protein
MNKEKGDASNNLKGKSENINEFIEQEINSRRQGNVTASGIGPLSMRSTQADSNSRGGSLNSIPDDPLQVESSTTSKKKSFLSKAFGKIKDKINKKTDIGKASIIVHNSNEPEEIEKIPEVGEKSETKEPINQTISTQNKNIEDDQNKKVQTHSRNSSQNDISKYLKSDYFEKTASGNNSKSSSFILPSGETEKLEDKPILTKSHTQVMKSPVKRLRKQADVETYIPEVIPDDSGFLYDFVLHRDEVTKIKNLRGKIIILNYLGTHCLIKF